MRELDAALDELIDRFGKGPYADEVVRARAAHAERTGRVFEDDELYEARTVAFLEWYVIERVATGATVPPAALTYRELRDAGDARADLVKALVTSQRSLYEVRALARGRIELLDLLGGAEFRVTEQRAMLGVEVGDVAELRLVGAHSEVRFGRTFIYHPKAARAAIVERARAMLAKGSSRRDVIDQIAQLRVQVTRYRHMAPARVYELGSRIMG